MAALSVFNPRRSGHARPTGAHLDLPEHKQRLEVMILDRRFPDRHKYAIRQLLEQAGDWAGDELDGTDGLEATIASVAALQRDSDIPSHHAAGLDDLMMRLRDLRLWVLA